MDFSAVTGDPSFFGHLGGRLLVLLLAVLFAVRRWYSIGGFFAWLATITSVLFGLF